MAEQVLESTEPVEWVAAKLWNTAVPIPFTQVHCQCVPQVDRVGKKDVRRWVKSLGALEHSWHEFYISGDRAFEWSVHVEGSNRMQIEVESFRIESN